jgi:hypothetical protein
MKKIIRISKFIAFSLLSLHVSAQEIKNDIKSENSGKKLFMDVHKIAGGKVSYNDVLKAHKKDLAVEKKYGVEIVKYWVNEDEGTIFCLAYANDSDAIRKTHAEAHGLLPQRIYEVSSGAPLEFSKTKNLYMDIHYLGAGNVTKDAVAGAHLKDLAVQNKYGADFLNYWVDEKEGVVMCLVQAGDAKELEDTHKEAHGLMPNEVLKVRAGK